MTAWATSDLRRVGDAEELDLASLRADGTLSNYTTMWVVRVEDDLYVRAYKGRESKWFRGVLRNHAGRIKAGGVERDVAYEEVPAFEPVNDEIDRAYRSKYATMPQQYVTPMYATTARAATIRIAPK